GLVAARLLARGLVVAFVCLAGGPFGDELLVVVLFIRFLIAALLAGALFVAAFLVAFLLLGGLVVAVLLVAAVFLTVSAGRVLVQIVSDAISRCVGLFFGGLVGMRDVEAASVRIAVVGVGLALALHAAPLALDDVGQ